MEISRFQFTNILKQGHFYLKKAWERSSEYSRICLKMPDTLMSVFDRSVSGWWQRNSDWSGTPWNGQKPACTVKRTLFCRHLMNRICSLGGTLVSPPGCCALCSDELIAFVATEMMLCLELRFELVSMFKGFKWRIKNVPLRRTSRALHSLVYYTALINFCFLFTHFGR